VLQISVTGAPAARRTSVLLIGDEVRRVVDDFRAIAAGYHCTIELRIVNDLPVAVDLDAVRQILNNFLDNACRHGGPDRQVVVMLRHVEGTMRLEVHDSGPGIAAGLREAVWQPFFRATQPEGREVSGSGIGLAVARQLATSMQGRTGIDPAPEGGAVVFLELPVAGVA
jgi:signal transduction histidine kinase